MVFFNKKNAEKGPTQLLLRPFPIRIFGHQKNPGSPGVSGPSNDHSFTEPSLEAVAMADELAVMKPQRLTISPSTTDLLYTQPSYLPGG